MSLLLSLLFSSYLWAQEFQGISALPLKDSSPTKAQDFKNKVILIDFWASWCQPCKEALPYYNELYLKYKDQGLILVGINEDEDPQDRDLFLKGFSPDFPLYQDKEQTMAKYYKVLALPTLLVLDREQKLVAVHRGFDQKKKTALEKQLRELLQLTNKTAKK